MGKQPFQPEAIKHGKVDKKQYRQEENLMVMGHGKKTISLQYSTRQAQNYDQKKLHRKGWHRFERKAFDFIHGREASFNK
jgi:hypothetical protein